MVAMQCEEEKKETGTVLGAEFDRDEGDFFIFIFSPPISTRLFPLFDCSYRHT